MKQHQQTTQRIAVFAALMIGGMVLLMGRLTYLQVFRHEALSQRAESQSHRMVQHLPMRGEIRDIRGNPLAISLPAKTVVADPVAMNGRHLEVARALAPALGQTESALAERLTPRVIRVQDGTNVYSRYVVLARKLPLERWQQATQALAHLPAPYTTNELATLPRRTRVRLRNEHHQVRFGSLIGEDDQLRLYPAKTLAAQVLGATAANKELNGLSGIELQFEKDLLGVSGWVRSEQDSRRRELSQYRAQEVEPRPGHNLVLTIDSGVQYILETEMARQMAEVRAQGIIGIVTRPRTGEILAMASHPTFDPGNLGEAHTNALRPRFITDQYEPGSTFKVVVVAGGLNEGKVSLADTVFCENGRFLYQRRILNDASPHGTLTVEEIIGKSSNIGSAKIGLMLGDQRLMDYVESFGFGPRTGISLPGEVAGTVHRPGSRYWSGLSIVQIPMGHGVASTALQMTMAMGAIANGGELMQPVLVDRIEDDKGNVVARAPRRVIRRVVGEAAARDMVQALRTATGPRGTAKNVGVEGFSVAGKTGTAQKPMPGGYSKTAFFSSFIGFLPADEPELLIAIIVDEPAYDPVKKNHQGGRAAAPAFQRVAERTANYLNLRPDLGTNSLMAPVVAADIR